MLALLPAVKSTDYVHHGQTCASLLCLVCAAQCLAARRRFPL